MTNARPKVALATYERAPDLAPDDRPLARALAARDIDATAAAWSSANTEWESFDVVVLRSCWDYHLRLDEFLAWLDRVSRLYVSVLNSPVLVRWNADKRYLLDLAARGVPTVPTVVAEQQDADAVYRAVDAGGWDKFVVKPAVSASGYETHLLTSLDEASRATIERIVALGAVLVQPFLDEIARDGELSFTFIDGEYSHATLKRARAGEFRVQTDHGGRSEATQPAPQLVREASRVVTSLPETPLYARVDGVVQNDRLLLMELELIEPNLFLHHRPGAPERLAGAIAGRLGR
ncbi:MAG: hypothetical protein ABI442_05240 [Gemmatimonadaceae bacterium]